MAPAVIDDFKPAASVPESEVTPANAPTIPDLFSLKNQTIVVTGGGRGLGITLALAVVEAGGSAVCLDILPQPSTEEWSTLSKLAQRSGASVVYERCDITNEAEVESALLKAAVHGAEHGTTFSGIVHCAGIQQKIPVIDYPAEDFRRIIDVNVTGSFLVAKHASRIFIDRKVAGSIVLIASMSGQIANRGLKCAAYNTSKSAVHQLCRSMAQEIGEHGIRINTLSPGYIRTAMTDALLANEPELEKVWLAGALLGRLGAPEDFKAPAVYLLSKGSSFMTGADLRVDGGHCASA